LHDAEARGPTIISIGRPANSLEEAAIRANWFGR